MTKRETTFFAPSGMDAQFFIDGEVIGCIQDYDLDLVNKEISLSWILFRGGLPFLGQPKELEIRFKSEDGIWGQIKIGIHSIKKYNLKACAEDMLNEGKIVFIINSVFLSNIEQPYKYQRMKWDYHGYAQRENG